MSSIFLVASSRNDQFVNRAAQSLASSLTVHSWQHNVLHSGRTSSCAIGLVANSAEGLEQQSCELHGCVAVVEGRVTFPGADTATGGFSSQARAVLLAYKAHGIRMGEHLDGHFTAYVLDESAGRAVAVNSRSAYTPTYEYRNGDTVALCSKLGPLAKTGFPSLAADAESVSTLLTYGQLFGNQTLVQGISTWAPATAMEVRLEEHRVDRQVYWDSRSSGPVSLPEHPDDIARRLCDVLGASADHLAATARADRVVSGLSGGYDSRLVTGLLADRIPGLKTWTFGARNAADLVVAEKLSTLFDISEHLVYPMRAEDIPRDIEEFVSSVDGCVTSNWAFAQKRKRELRSHGDLVLNGFAGDAYLGGSMTGGKYQAAKAWALNRLRGSRIAPNPYLERNTTPEAVARFIAHGSKLGGSASGTSWYAAPTMSLEEYALESLGAFDPYVPMWYIAEHWLLDQRAMRQTIMAVVADRPFYDDDSLFYDYNVIDHCLSIHPALRRGHRMYKKIFELLLPEAGKIENSNTGLSSTMPQYLVTSHKIVTKLREKISGHPSSHVTDTTGVNAEEWTRGILKDFYGDLINDSRTQSRPFWDGTMLRVRFDAHQRGELDFSGPLGLIASIEIFCRSWLD